MKGVMSGSSGREQSSVKLFDGSENDTGDPFDSARETKYISSQISILDYSIFILGLYTLGMSSITWPMEFDEDYENRYLFLSFITISSCSIVMTVFLGVRNLFLLKLAIHRKEASEKTRLWELFSIPNLIGECLFILIHPNWLCHGIKIWVFDHNLNNFYYYH